MNIAQNLENAQLSYAENPALIFDGQSYSYREVNESANRVANLLTTSGIKRGETVALFLPNIPQFYFAYFGILKLGGIAVSINSRLMSDEVKFILEDSDAQAVITTADLLANIPKDMPCQLLVAGSDIPDSHSSFDVLLSSTSTEYKSVDMSHDSPAAILYTSGTTGTPKGAVLSHSNVLSNATVASKFYDIKEGDRMLLFLPLFHCFGQNAIMNAAIACGAAVVLHQRFVAAEILQSIQQNRVTHFYGVPTVFIWFLNAEIKQADLATVRYYFSAAAKLPMEIAQRWNEHFGSPIHEGYGLTETSPFSSYNHESDYRLGSIGTPIEHVAMQIWDEDNNPLKPHELGEIVVKGPNIMLGYWNRPDETAQAMRGGWFHTGDIGYVDEDGYFYITDRLKDMINISGLKVYPAEVENILYQHPAIQEAAVYGVSNELTGEAVWATITLKEDYQTTDEIELVEELIIFCEERIASFKVPRIIKFIDAIPKNPTGKILKRVLVAEAENAMPA